MTRVPVLRRPLAWATVLSIVATGIGFAQVVQRPPAATEMRQAAAPASNLLSMEDRVARLEAELQKSREREAALEQRLATHTHSYGYWEVGLLREPLSGRPVDLAISPQYRSAQTGPAAP